MKKNQMIYVKDIAASLNIIESHIKNMNYEEFSDDITTQDAVLRRLEIVGEAASKVDLEYRKSHPTIPWRNMIGLRNIIIHDYSSVNLEEIWRIVTEELKATIAEIEKLL
jgi:uncharacterized protein with HEPN domain